MERVLGLRMHARLSPLLGRRAALFISIAIAAVRFAVRPRSGWFAGFQALIVQCIVSITSLCATAAVCLDAIRAAQIAERLAPLSVLGSDTGAAYAYRFARMLATAPRENVVDIIAESRLLLARLDDKRPIRLMPGSARDVMRAGVLQLLGAMELFCADSDTLSIANRLEQTGMVQDRATADQLRLSYHALRGEAKLANAFRNKVEMHAIQGGTLWLFEVWSPSLFILVYISSLDTMGLKRLTERFDRLVQEVPSVRHDATMVKAEYHHLKGDHAIAFAIATPVLESTSDRSFMGRSAAVATHCRALNQLERHAEAKAILEPMIDRLSEADRRVAALYINLSREFALAHAGLRDFDQAFRVLDENLARYAHSKHPLLLGNLHSTVASVAIAAGDMLRALEHSNEMGRWFRGTENPVLIAQHEKLSRRLRAMQGIAIGAEFGAQSPATEQRTLDVQSALSRLTQLRAAEERADYALRLLLDHIQASTGYLFVKKHDEPSLIAPFHGEEPPPALLERVAIELRSASETDERTIATTDGVATRAEGRSQLSTQALYVIHPLETGGRTRGVLAALQREGGGLRRPRRAFLNAVASALFDALEEGGTSDEASAAVTKVS
jgi:tetratricopeptide (TPR) repeat protein